jgi:ABC-type nitrate/sulfonate/bicarbonate transport system substrate-binding protein
MTQINRRQFIRGSGAAGSLAVLSLPAFLAACGGDDGATTKSATAAAGGGGKVTTPKFGLSSSPQASYIPILAGPIAAGKQFGLNVTKKDFTVFDSSTTATQSALSGKLGILGQSTMAQLLLIERGLPFKLFCPYILSDDFVIATRSNVTDISQLKDVVVASDSPGGAGTSILDAILVATNAGFLASDLPKKIVVESSGERTSALANGDCDATIIHLPQANSIPSKAGKINIVGRLYGQVPNFLKEGFAARTDWLDKNVETAAAVAASVISVSRDMAKDYAAWTTNVKEFVDEPPPASDLKQVFPLIDQYKFWPVDDDGGMNDERIQFMIDLGRKEGLIKKDLKVDDVVDRRPLQRAAELLKG